MTARASSKAHWITTIRTKLALTIVVAAVIPLLIVGYASYTKQQSLELEEAFARLEGLATAQVGQLDRMVQSDGDTASIIANHPDVRRALAGTGSAEEAEATLENLIAVVPRLEAVALFDGDGEPVAATADTVSASLAADMIGGGNLIGTVMENTSGSLVMLSCTELQTNGEVIGTVMVETDIDPITQLATNYKGLSQTGETSVAQQDENGDAQFIAPLRFKEDAVMTITVPSTAAAAPITRALAGDEDRFADTVDYREQAVLAVTRTVDSTGWGVVVKMDRAEALAGTSDFQRSLFAAIVAAVALGILASMALARRISSPLRRLTRTAVAITDGDVDSRSTVSSNDEIGTLAGAMNTMADSLVEAASEEAQRTTQLENVNGRLRRKEASVRSILDNAAEGIMSVGADGTILEFNPAAEKIFDRDANHAIGAPVADMLTLPGDQALTGLTAGLAAAGRNGPDGTEMVAHRSDGTSIPVHVAVSAVGTETNGSGVTYTAIVRDISERLAFEQQLSHLATHDSLTGLPNRDLFDLRLEGRTRRQDQPGRHRRRPLRRSRPVQGRQRLLGPQERRQAAATGGQPAE